MAYAAAETRSSTHHDGVQHILIVLAETDAATASEATLSGLPVVGRVMRVTSSLTSGTGTVLDSIVGVSTAPAGADVVVENGDPAAIVDMQTASGYRYYSPTGTLYLRNRVNDATADHVIASRLLIVAGWGD